MTIAELVNRLDDAVNALERIAVALETLAACVRPKGTPSEDTE